ncbi:hypothetical protein [Curtobacterium sp. MCSS17_006]|uniref:hypothetical protein n=1 Tax=Curtobacterium sp. MCSS17_006 TaxID=2175642 RepID=UPI0015E88D58|nr:hypothetical protein [Curtobacterium sp. MCSS17_006]
MESITIECDECAERVPVDVLPGPAMKRGSSIWVDMLPDMTKLDEHLAAHA